MEFNYGAGDYSRHVGIEERLSQCLKYGTEPNGQVHEIVPFRACRQRSLSPFK
jgi:hypothetical protein